MWWCEPVPLMAGDVVDHGRAAGDGDVFAFNIGTQWTAVSGETFA